ncbi:MAG: hypothetical protein LKJ06_07935 [Schleiferilactobacillus harbinensis]|jgi:uncharacterized protein YlzI (FlbEa/FlbD family)|nr:hypothetical protein [Schleiferilactobacillus harbinensis]
MGLYYTAKLNISGNLFSNNLQEIKLKAIPETLMKFSDQQFGEKMVVKESTQKTANSVRYNRWILTDMEKIDEGIIEGNLTKIFPREEIVLEGVRTKTTVEDQIRTAHFFYVIRDELLAFQSTTDINYQVFPRKFEILMKKADTDLQIGDVRIELLTRIDEFKQKLFSQPVRRVLLKFVTPNDPKTTDSIADILLGSRAKKADFKMENFTDDEGLQAKDSDGQPVKLFSDFFLLLERGYGSLKAWVGNRNRPEVIESEKFPVKANIRRSTNKTKTIADIESEVKKIEKLKSSKKDE